jgi:hypothetical protein
MSEGIAITARVAGENSRTARCMTKQDGRPSLLLLAPLQNQRASNAPTVKHAELTTLDGPMALFGPLATNLITPRRSSVSSFLDNYMTAEERIELFAAANPDFRMESSAEVKDGFVFVLVKLYRTWADATPWVTGLAGESLKTSFAIEKAETSAYARAITNSGDPKFSTMKDGSKAPRANRAEMETVSFTVSEVKGAESLGTSLALIKDQLGATELEESPICSHGHMILKTGSAKSTGKEWRGYMCTERVKANQCSPIWQKQTAMGGWYTPKPDLADHL